MRYQRWKLIQNRIIFSWIRIPWFWFQFLVNLDSWILFSPRVHWNSVFYRIRTKNPVVYRIHTRILNPHMDSKPKSGFWIQIQILFLTGFISISELLDSRMFFFFEFYDENPDLRFKFLNPLLKQYPNPGILNSSFLDSDSESRYCNREELVRGYIL